MTTPAPPLKATKLFRALRSLKRSLRPPAAPARVEGTLTVSDLPVAVEAGGRVALTLTLYNTGPDAWPARGAGAVGVTWQWLRHDGQPLGMTQSQPLDGPAYPGEPRAVACDLAAPEFVGDYLLTATLDGHPVASARHEVAVLGRRQTDIDYHAVYRTADLNENHWWVVGGYYTKEQYEESARQRRTMLEQNAGLTPSSRVLDVGCGTGQVGDSLVDYLADSGAYYGCDIGREAIEFCRARFPRPNYQFAVSGMTTIPFPADEPPFDLAIYFSVFTHTYVDESLLLLGETCRRLAPGGRIAADIITSPVVLRGQGHRGEMVVNAEHFFALARLLGLVPTVIGRWPWNPHAERLMVVFSRHA